MSLMISVNNTKYIHLLPIFTDHHTPDAMSGYRDAVLVCKMHDCYSTMAKIPSIYFHSFSSGLFIKRRIRQAIAMFRLNENKQLLNVFSTTYTIQFE